MWRIAVVAGTVALIVLSGCSSDPPKKTVEFGSVDNTQDGPGADFELRVRVLGVDKGTQAIPFAFVGAAEGEQALAKAFTNTDGEAVLYLKKDQSIRLVSQARDWTTEESARIGIGVSRNDKGPDATCVDGPFVPCIVVDFREAPEYHLDGERGLVTMTLFRSSVAQEFKINVSPHANGRVFVPPDNMAWFPKSEKLSDEAAIHDVYMDRLESVSARLTWTNSMLSQGDFELGVGCQSERVEKETDGGMASTHLANQGQVQVTLGSWEPKSEGRWSLCDDVYAGPIVDSVSSSVDTTVKLVLEFEGKSRIIPLNA